MAGRADIFCRWKFNRISTILTHSNTQSHYIMTNIQRGFRCKLEEHVNIGAEFTVDVSVAGSATYDYSCFGVDANNKLSDDRYMVFYNQTASPNNEIVLSQSSAGATYRVNLSKLPASINKLVFRAYP